jgi:iron(III) transport system substrate-binding protein
MRPILGKKLKSLPGYQEPNSKNQIARSKFQFWYLVLGIWLLAVSGCGRSKARVVLYCAQDREFAEEILADFSSRTGLEVIPKYDIESEKSVGLALEISREKSRPRCDVHWNNEILWTIRLQRQGLLEPYASPSATPYPSFTKAKDNTWHAFAERARVLLVNTKLVPKEEERPRGLLDLTDPRWKGRVVMAKPNFGTSATQASCLFEVLGPEKAKQFYLGLKNNGVQIVPGNKQVAEGVSGGDFAVGITDTDDAIGEVSAGKPVTIIFPDGEAPKASRMGTLFIPNTVAIIRGGPNPAGARQLVDFLLSPEVEAKLAESDSHQIPMNPQVHAVLPKEFATRQTAKAMEVDFEKAADLWDEVQEFLRKEFARP